MNARNRMPPALMVVLVFASLLIALPVWAAAVTFFRPREWLQFALLAQFAIIAFALMAVVWQRSGLMATLVLAGVSLSIPLIWAWFVTGDDPDKLVTVAETEIQPAEASDTLIVIVHGAGGPQSVGPVFDAIKANIPNTDILKVDFGEAPWHRVSNSDAVNIARGVSRRIQQTFDRREKPYRHLILVGHSMGASIARKAFLVAKGACSELQAMNRVEPSQWADNVQRFVLLAGINRGWDISGRKPSDMSTGTYLKYWTLLWFARLTGTAKMMQQFETGSPFMANLRLDWMRLSRRLTSSMPETVQLLGDIDDVVSDADNKDLRVAAADNFTWLKVRGTGHADICDLGEPAGDSDRQVLRPYRQEKLLRAINSPFAEIRRENEEQPYQTDDQVTHGVFVLHGIRDMGRWSAQFEDRMLKRFKRDHPDTLRKKLAIISPRYGYFGMGPFLLRSKREKYVRWLMDEYTETLARFPKLEESNVHFVGHSNGTYLLAKALQDYPSMRMNRVVFAGSVVRRKYDWQSRQKLKQVEAVRNYVASDDWVVGLFPRLFESFPFRKFNDLGSAGFRGFNPPDAVPGTANCVQNVGPITGYHSAFLADKQLDSIVDYILEKNVMPPDAVESKERSSPWLDFVSDWCCWAVWLGILVVAFLLGVYLIDVAEPFALPVAAAYVGFLLWLLNRI